MNQPLTVLLGAGGTAMVMHLCRFLRKVSCEELCSFKEMQINEVKKEALCNVFMGKTQIKTTTIMHF